MTLNWETFKTAAGLTNTSLAYIDDEGSKIPIESDCEFQEALRLAKLNKNRLKFVLYEDKEKPSERMSFGLPQQAVLKQSEKFLEEFMKTVNQNSNMKGDSCCCHGDAPPEWFQIYMKKFQKELLYELKSHVNDVVHSALEKEKKLSSTRSDVAESFCQKSKNSITPLTEQNKKKKVSERDLIDLIDQREIKLPKKLEKLHATKSERLEKLDNKIRVFLEEKRRLLERKRHSKTKLDKNSMTTDKKNLMKKSALFRPNDLYIFLPPGSKFSVSLNVINDGKIRWSAPRLQCFELSGLSLKEDRISLPRLLPMESCSVTLKGQVSQSTGLHLVKCKVVDGSECFGPEFTCFARVEPAEYPESPSGICKESDDKEWIVATDLLDEGTLIDFEKNIISSSQRKIEENISEIERRLRDIDLLRPSTSEENFKNNSTDFLDGNEKSWKERLIEEELRFGSEVNASTNVTRNLEIDIEKDKIEEGLAKSTEKDGESESCSKSDTSLSFKFEDEDNFIFVPSESPSPAESANEEKNFLMIDMKDRSPEANDPLKSQPKTPEEKPSTQEHVQKNEAATSTLQRIFNRRSPFAEEISKPKKMKSKSTEYRFTAANLTQPTFTKYSEGVFYKPTSKFNFKTGEEEEDKSTEYRFTAANLTQPTFTKHSEGVFYKPTSKFNFKTGEEEVKRHAEEITEERPQKFTFTGAKRTKSKEKSVKRNVLKTDALGKVIYAVNSNGYCVPVDNAFDTQGTSGSVPKCSRTPERRNERTNDFAAVNILPDALMNGASNVASFAFNTAKSVINNFQSAFVTEGKTEFGQPAYEDKCKVSMDAMFKLYDMGFLDLQVNRKLLMVHENDLDKVIEELVRLNKKSAKNSQ